MILRNRPDLAARLADFALARGIETDFVRLLIERNALPAPVDAGPAWPFRLRIRALGGFELVRDGQPMRFSGKAQQRPLDLLKVVVAQGGAGVDSAAVMAALWPDADGAAAKTSFDTALFRLRKLLDVDGAVQLTGGKLSLAPALVWTDVRALEAALGAAERACEDPPDGRTLAHAARTLLAAYPGPLLGTEEAPWFAKPRDAWRSRVLRALTALGGALEHARRLGDGDRRLSARPRGRQPRRTPLPRPDALARRDRRPGRGAGRLSPLPRAPLRRARAEALGRDRAAAPRHHGKLPVSHR